MTPVDFGQLVLGNGVLWSPMTFGVLVALAAGLIWLAFTPAWSKRDVESRLDDYLDRAALLEPGDMSQPFGGRVVLPLVRRLLRAFGRLTPKRRLESTQQMLIEAGEPGRLTALDFFGLQLLLTVLLGAGYFFLLGRAVPFNEALRNTLFAAVLGYLLPAQWLRRRARQRKHDILRTLPDALDMLTTGVEAGLAFESALLRVGERWDNALTHEFLRAVSEIRVGSARDVALQHMAQRAGVLELSTFVAVLIQSTQLGVSIAQVLHTQAAQMRIRRRQHAEELARKAGAKMVFPLVFLIFPALYVVILGPAMPGLIATMKRLGGG